jgi:hypothetical protein
MQAKQKNTAQVLKGWEGNIRSAQDEAIRAVGTEASEDLNVISTPGREVEGITQAFRKGPLAGNTPLSKVTDFHDRMTTLNDLVWHPSSQSVNAARESFQRGLHLPTDVDIDMTMHSALMSHLGQLTPLVRNALKTLNKVGADTLADPFAWASDGATAIRDMGLADKLADAPSASQLLVTAAHHAAVNPATKPLIHAGVTAGRLITGQAYRLLKKHGAGPFFEHLAEAYRGTKNSAADIAKNLHDAFVVRPDLLDAGLTPTGRDVRVQLENASRVRKVQDFKKDESVVHSADASAARFQEYAAEHGPQGTGSLKDADFKNENLPVPKSQVKEWEKKVTDKMFPKGINEGLARGDKAGLAERTAKVQEKMQKLRPDLDAAFRKARPNKLDNIRQMDPDERSEFFSYLRDNVHKNELARKSKDVFSEAGGKALIKKGAGSIPDWESYRAPKVTPVAKAAKTAADLGRAGIELNPLPHAVGNVGTLQFLGGGLDAVTRGVAAMVKPVDHVAESTLTEMGAGVPEYIGGHMGGVPGYADLVNRSSGILHKMELGWRTGMLEHLDRVMGPTVAGTKAHYIKGALINKKLGDYNALTAFARTFASFGGPYVAYKFGVLPKALLDSIIHNPINVETLLRTEGQVQDNRAGAKEDKYSGSDPGEELGQMTTNPLQYVINTATMGAVHDINEVTNDWNAPQDTHETWDQGLFKIAQNHFAPLGVVAGAMENAQGKSMAGQPMTFADHVISALISSLNQHIHHNPSEKTARKRERYIDKHAFTPED